jgi:hypothetical protein
MFQYFLAGNVSVFGNMANKNNRDGFFGEFNQFCRGFLIWDTSCGRFDIIGMKGLNRINDYNFGSIASICLKMFWVLVSVRM